MAACASQTNLSLSLCHSHSLTSPSSCHLLLFMHIVMSVSVCGNLYNFSFPKWRWILQRSMCAISPMSYIFSWHPGDFQYWWHADFHTGTDSIENPMNYTGIRFYLWPSLSNLDSDSLFIHSFSKCPTPKIKKKWNDLDNVWTEL